MGKKRWDAKSIIGLILLITLSDGSFLKMYRQFWGTDRSTILS